MAGERTVASVWGEEVADELARWAIDAIVYPPVVIETATTRISRRKILEGRELLEAAGMDWKKLKRGTRSEHTERKQAGGS